ncbi:tetratricopeptide repeat protein, partial [Alkalihalophilus lindianensis]|nr:tetratricopeptide repeat protein [Alkalihalophilus lindianensis]
TIEALLDEKEVPPEKYEHFLTILQFSRKMAAHHEESAEPSPTNDGNQELGLLSDNNLNDQLLLVSSLADKNIRPFFNEIEE